MEYSRISVEPFSCKVTLGLQRGYTGVAMPQNEYIKAIQAYQDQLITDKDLYLSISVSQSQVVLSGQCEPHLVLRLINYPRFPLSPETLKPEVENLVSHLMEKFGQNSILWSYLLLKFVVMHVSLTPHWEKFIENKLSTGRYKSASEVFREALRLLEERDEKHQARLTTLRDDLETGRQGEPIYFDAESIKHQTRQFRSEKS